MQRIFNSINGTRGLKVIKSQTEGQIACYHKKVGIYGEIKKQNNQFKGQF